MQALVTPQAAPPRVQERDIAPTQLVGEDGCDGVGVTTPPRVWWPRRHRRAPLVDPDGAPATPRLYVVRSRCPELAQQLEDAPLLPIDSGRMGAGEIVDPAWEGRHGHAVAALRYGVMGAPGASTPPEDQPPDDPRAAYLWMIERQQEKDWAYPWNARKRYE